MTDQPNNGSDLSRRLGRAIESYEVGWKSVDEELHELFRRRPSHRDYSDVYTKVVMIERVYRAGVLRAFKGDAKAKAEITVARELVAQADVLEGHLAALADQTLNRKTALQIVELHGWITASLAPSAGDVWLTSFVSKYLHFHCPIVPVYDSKAAGSVGGFVKSPTDQQSVTALRRSLGHLRPSSRAYRSFVPSFVALYQRARAETSPEPSVKEVDYMLLLR
jgi:hypothetical protein